MSLRRRLLRILLVLVAVFLFAGYFAFSTFLFSPLESAYGPDLSTLVPRDVDFFFAKARLIDDFEDFPRPAAMDELEQTIGWSTLVNSPEYREFLAGSPVDEALAEIDRIEAQLYGMELLNVLGGRDAAVAGYFRGPALERADWTLYGRANWAGKLGVEALSYPGLLGLQEQGLTVAEEEDVVSLSGGQLARPLFATRIRDVVVVGTSREMVVAAPDLAARSGEDSFGQSARYFDHVEHSDYPREGDEVEMFVDVRALLEAKGLPGRWPDPAAQDIFPAFLGKLFQLGSLNELIGVADPGGGFGMRLHGELSSEVMTQVQKRIYRTRGFDRGQLGDQAAKVARADANWFLYAHVNLRDLLGELFRSFGAADRELVEDTLRSTREYSSAESLIDELAGVLRERVAVVARANDYPYTETDPPHDGAPVPAVAVVFWLGAGAEANTVIDELQDLVLNHQQRFGLRGRNPGEKGVYRNKTSGGHTMYEFWNPLLPGTGHISTCRADDLFVISNSYLMVGDVIQTYYGNRPNLTTYGPFKALVSGSLADANIAFWINPRTTSDLLRQQASRRAEDEALASIDWTTERIQTERRLLREEFGNQRPSQLTPGDRQALDTRVDEVLRERQVDIRNQQIPAIRAALERQILYSEMVSGALLAISLDPKSIELAMRALIPFDT